MDWAIDRIGFHLGRRGAVATMANSTI